MNSTDNSRAPNDERQNENLDIRYAGYHLRLEDHLKWTVITSTFSYLKASFC